MCSMCSAVLCVAGVLLTRWPFHQCLLACSFEVVAASYRMGLLSFPTIPAKLALKPFDLSKMIGPFVKAEPSLPRCAAAVQQRTAHHACLQCVRASKSQNQKVAHLLSTVTMHTVCKVQHPMCRRLLRAYSLTKSMTALLLCIVSLAYCPVILHADVEPFDVHPAWRVF